MIEPLQPAHVIVGSAVKLDCVIEGAQLEVLWYKAGQDITDDSRYKVSSRHTWLMCLFLKLYVGLRICFYVEIAFV